MFGLGFWELGLILLVALLVLGPKKLPELAKTLGKGLRELRRASDDIRSTISEPLDEIRKPLQDIRDDLVGTVHNVGREIEREAHLEQDPVKAAEEAVEIENRRREVEELYANAAKEDQLLEESTDTGEALPDTVADAPSVAAADPDPDSVPETAAGAPASAELLPGDPRPTSNPPKS